MHYTDRSAFAAAGADGAAAVLAYAAGVSPDLRFNDGTVTPARISASFSGIDAQGDPITLFVSGVRDQSGWTVVSLPRPNLHHP